MPTLKFKKLMKEARIPSYATEEAAGMDVHSAEYVTLKPGVTVVVRTGISCEIPVGWELQCRPRSGLASKGIVVVNSPGTIDSDYRGEIKVILHSLIGSAIYEIEPGDRIAQLVLAEVPRMEIEEVDELSKTVRGSGGFGSTGK